MNATSAFIIAICISVTLLNILLGLMWYAYRRRKLAKERRRRKHSRSPQKRRQPTQMKYSTAHPPYTSVKIGSAGSPFRHSSSQATVQTASTHYAVSSYYEAAQSIAPLLPQTETPPESPYRMKAAPNFPHKVSSRLLDGRPKASRQATAFSFDTLESVYSSASAPREGNADPPDRRAFGNSIKRSKPYSLPCLASSEKNNPYLNTMPSAEREELLASDSTYDHLLLDSKMGSQRTLRGELPIK